MKEYYVKHGDDPIADLKKRSVNGGNFENWYDFSRKQWIVVELSDKEISDREERSIRERNRRMGLNRSKLIPCDLPEYISPITGKPVDGRAARREDLKRSGCRESDPSEFKVEYKNERFINKHGIQQ